jgi:hypothetical protein
MKSPPVKAGLGVECGRELELAHSTATNAGGRLVGLSASAELLESGLEAQAELLALAFAHALGGGHAAVEARALPGRADVVTAGDDECCVGKVINLGFHQNHPFLLAGLVSPASLYTV